MMMTVVIVIHDIVIGMKNKVEHRFGDSAIRRGAAEIQGRAAPIRSQRDRFNL